MKKFLAALLGLLIAAPAAAQTLIYNASGGSGAITFPVTVSGATSGGIPCFTASTTMASSGVLGANQIVVGGGAGVCPTSSANFISDSLGTVTTQGLTTTLPGFYAQVTGDTFPRVRVGLNSMDIASIAFGGGSGARDLFLERAAAANLRQGAPDAASPVAQIASVQSVVAGTSNTAGAAWTFKGSQGTGTGAGGSILFQTAPAGTTGTAQNALATALIINSAGQLQFGGVTSSFPLIKRNGASLELRLADDSNYASITANTVTASSGVVILGNSAGQLQLSGSTVFIPSTSNFGIGTDTVLSRDAANTLALRNGANAQTFNVYNTFTDASNYERLEANWASTANVLRLQTTNAGTGTARALYIIAGGSELRLATNGNSANGFKLDVSGDFLASNDNTQDIGASGANRPRNYFGAGSATLGASVTAGNAIAAGGGNFTLKDNGNGIGTLLNAAQTDFVRLQFGGTTSSFPALKRSSAVLQARLADDSAYGAFEANTVRTATAYTVGTLPTGSAGMRAYVTDQLTSCVAAGLALTGGGAVVCPAFYNGSAWVGD